METLHEIIKDSVSGGFFQFVGYLIVLSMLFIAPLKILFLCLNRFLRHRNISKYGYPPAHCDADGDFKRENND